ncbi:eukaryotic translation initiation factor 3 subunit A-like [Lineus longissimus]|uniref:eukaryotic translation initiation factor 3 subunit A-like n=1 Tax=Lineus longissimus TaxID=88925 RepID=UPI002B4C6175
MPTYFQRPENALKRANEFIDVGKKQRALDALYDVIKSKKHRTWQKIHEPIMLKYLELCVDLKKSHVAKEGLYQYKNICQQVNIKSLEDVVRKYLALAEEKTEEARQESHQAVADIANIDDLDVITTPESLLLSAVSGEDTQDRTDRAILTPWVKFLWESYRQCLELLRNNNRVEKLYQDIAQQAFKFCLKYSRKTEFRKLCDNLRTHLGHIHKHQAQQTAINLNNPESQALHLETRLVQLESAIQMELWQEAFKAVEDIYGLVSMSKKPPKPSLMANYYQKLGMVFWKSGNHLFHACAWHRLFQLCREQKKSLSAEELQRMASRVLCATLAIPIPPNRDKLDALIDQEISTLDKQRRLATLLGLQNPPTRISLIKDLVKYNVIQFVNPELHNLYKWLEVEFHPLKLAQRISSSLEYIEKNEELVQFIPPLQDITIMRILKQVSQVYQTIEFSRLEELIPFSSSFHLERVVVEAARTLDLQVRIDHRTRCLTFGTDLAGSQKEDVPEGPYLQGMPSEQIRNQLILMAEALQKVQKMMQPKSSSTVREELRAHIIETYRHVSKREHQRILLRRQIIEDRKEQLENINVQREHEENQKLEDERKKQMDAEKERLEREMEQRARQRLLEERKEIAKRHAKEKLEQLKKSEIGAKAFRDIDEEDLAGLDAEEIMAKQVQQIEKEKKELQDRLKSQEKKHDYMMRARREEEIPLLLKDREEEKAQAEEFWKKEEEERIAKLIEEHDIAIEHRDRLLRMRGDRDIFLNDLKDKRKTVHKDNLKNFEIKLAEERKLRVAERKQQRKDERQMKRQKEREEAEQRAKDEALKKEREEKERLEIEQREKEEAEYREVKERLERAAAKQREKEREIEERLAKEKAERDREPKGREDDKWRRDRDIDSRRSDDRNRGRDEADDAHGPNAWRPKPKEGSGWRDRLKEKEERWEKGPVADRGRDTSPGRDRNRSPPRRSPPRARSPPPRARSPPPRARSPPPRARSPPPARDAWRRDDRGGDRWRDEPRGGDKRDERGGDRDGDRGGDSWRRGGSGGGGFDRGGRRDEPRRDDRDEWRRGGGGGSERGGTGGGSSWRDSRDSRGPPPRDRDGDSRDFRGDRDRDRGGDRDLRGDRDRGDRDIRSDRDGGRGGGAWRRGGDDTSSRGDDAPSRGGGGGAWRRGGDDGRRGGERDVEPRGSPTKDDRWRKSEDRPKDRPAGSDAPDDGWVQVRR